MFLTFSSIITIIIFIQALTSTIHGRDNEFIFQDFSSHMDVHGSSAITNTGLLRLTSIGSNDQAGQVFYERPIAFKNPATNSSFSFSTMFVIQIVPEIESLSGSGMAFIIAPTTDLSGAQPGGFLGFMNSTHNGNSDDHIVAVEFDTVPNPEFNETGDDFNQVGIDINSVVSENATQAGYYADDGGKLQLRNITLYSGDPIQVWVDYDANRTLLSVTMSPLGAARPNRSLLTLTRDISPVLLNSMYVGFSASTERIQTAHYVIGWSFNVSGPAAHIDAKSLTTAPPTEHKAPCTGDCRDWKRNFLIILIIAAVLIPLILAAGLAYIILTRRKAGKT